MTNLFEKPLAILGILLAILLIGGFAGLKIGKALQSNTDSKALSASNKSLTSAVATVTKLNQKLKDVNDQTAQAQAEAEAQKKRADQEKQALAQQIAEQAKSEATWAKKLADADKKPGCKTLEETLCDSVMDY